MDERLHAVVAKPENGGRPRVFGPLTEAESHELADTFTEGYDSAEALVLECPTNA